MMAQTKHHTPIPTGQLHPTRADQMMGLTETKSVSSRHGSFNHYSRNKIFFSEYVLILKFLSTIYIEASAIILILSGMVISYHDAHIMLSRLRRCWILTQKKNSNCQCIERVYANTFKSELTAI